MSQVSAGRWGAIEAGGTKFVCLVGSSPEHIEARTRIPTGAPGPTLAQVTEFFRSEVDSRGPLDAVGIAAFGPLELRESNPRYGFITTSPKPGWSDVDIVGPVRAALGVPVGIHTDVAGAALGETRWGAAQDVDTFVYMTVGTGIGAAAIVGGRVAPGLVHAEMGHIGVRRQAGDDFPGNCPFHGDCLEGMAGGSALAGRWGRPAEQLGPAQRHQAVAWEAGYLAEGLRTIVYTIAPQRIILGGSVTALPGLFPALRATLTETLAGYPGLPEHSTADFVVPPGLGSLAGSVGAFVLAETALSERG